MRISAVSLNSIRLPLGSPDILPWVMNRLLLSVLPRKSNKSYLFMKTKDSAVLPPETNYTSETLTRFLDIGWHH